MSNVSSIHFTVSAAEKVAMLIEEEKNPELNLRVAINGGGCSGFEYGISFDEKIQADDTVIIQHCSNGKPVQLVVDFISHQYLENAEIDYVQNIQGERFVIRNPNAKTTCGCGSSFSIADEDSDEAKDIIDDKG